MSGYLMDMKCISIAQVGGTKHYLWIEEPQPTPECKSGPGFSSGCSSRVGVLKSCPFSAASKLKFVGFENENHQRTGPALLDNFKPKISCGFNFKRLILKFIAAFLNGITLRCI
jgi:hypothetical protein